jgi:hypothetical protein
VLTDIYRKSLAGGVVEVLDSVQSSFEGSPNSMTANYLLSHDDNTVVALYDPSDLTSWEWLFGTCLPLLMKEVDGSPLSGVLVATKMDRLAHDEQSGVDVTSRSRLEDASGQECDTADTERVVNRHQGEMAAADWNMGYCEVSAKVPLDAADWGANRVFALALERQKDGDQMVQGQFPNSDVMTKSARKT